MGRWGLEPSLSPSLFPAIFVVLLFFSPFLFSSKLTLDLLSNSGLVSPSRVIYFGYASLATVPPKLCVYCEPSPMPSKACFANALYEHGGACCVIPLANRVCRSMVSRSPLLCCKIRFLMLACPAQWQDRVWWRAVPLVTGLLHHRYPGYPASKSLLPVVKISNMLPQGWQHAR